MPPSLTPHQTIDHEDDVPEDKQADPAGQTVDTGLQSESGSAAGEARNSVMVNNPALDRGEEHGGAEIDTNTERA